MVRKIGVAVMAATLLFSAAACGGGDDRPSVDDITKTLKDKGADSFGLGDKFNDDTAKCFAKAIEKSDLSDKAVKALVDGDKDFKPSKSDEEALGGVTSDFAKCIPTP